MKWPIPVLVTVLLAGMTATAANAQGPTTTIERVTVRAPAHRTIASAYEGWVRNVMTPAPPVMCLYGRGTASTHVELVSAVVHDGECALFNGEGADKAPLFGVGYMVPPSYDSRLTRSYYGDAACEIGERVVVSNGDAMVPPTMVLIVYSGGRSDIGRVLYAYCLIEEIEY
jgi:hypothetical protein